MSDNGKRRGIQTEAIHAAEPPDGLTRATSPNLVMSSTYVVDEEISFSANNLTDDAPFVYTRWSNPTTRQLEKKLAILEQAEACIAFATGMAATTAVLLHYLSSGDHIVMANTNYPGTAEYARDTLPRYGIEVTPVDASDVNNIAAAMRDNTRIVWIETPSNPLIQLADIRQAAAVAHDNSALLVVDSTFATPVATRPIQMGADLVVHSLTKFIGGHGDAMGGAVIGRQELLATLRGDGLIHQGGVISPFNSWLILRGIATLPIRMKSHQKNALQVAEFLESHSRVERVLYPGLESHPQHELAKSQMDNFSGILSFRIAEPHAVADKMMQELEVIHYAVSLGHHRSLIYLMQTKDLIESSYRLSGEQLTKYRDTAGEGLFRFSVGLEDAEDLCADLDAVL